MAIAATAIATSKPSAADGYRNSRCIKVTAVTPSADCTNSQLADGSPIANASRNGHPVLTVLKGSVA